MQDIATKVEAEKPPPHTHTHMYKLKELIFFAATHVASTTLKSTKHAGAYFTPLAMRLLYNQ